MQITPKAAGAPLAPQSPDQSLSKAQAARARAISIMAGQAQQPVVANQTQVTAEEMGAVRPPTQAKPQEISQNSIVESPEVPAPNVDNKAEKPEDPTLSRQFAQLAKQERQLRMKVQQQEQALKAREEALKAKEQEYALKDQEYAQRYIKRDFLKDNPLQALAEAEVSYDDLTQQILNSPTQQDPRLLATISKLEEKIKSLEAKTTEFDASQKTAAEAQRAAAVKQIEADTKKLVDSDDSYEMIKATASHKDVVELIERTFDEDGVLLSVEEAAQEIENYLLDEALKLSRLNKVTQKLRPAASPSETQSPAATSVQSKEQPAPTMKTLTNAAASTRPLTARERALLAFEGKLK